MMSNRMARVPLRTPLAITLTALVLTACGGGDSTPTPAAGGGTPSSSTPVPGGGSAATVTGSVFAAATNGALVTAYALGANGQPTGSALGTANTDNRGAYTLTLSTLPTGAVILVATGGSYASEADGTAQSGPTFSVVVPKVTASTVAHLNPLTSAVAVQASSVLAAASGTSVDSALATAVSTIKKQFGLTDLTANPQTLAPNASATSGDAWLLSALTGTLEQLRAITGLSPADLYKALLDDIADGKLDGFKNGQSITLGSGGTLRASLFTSQLSGAANAYGNNHTTYAPATAKISAALQSSAQAVGLVASSGSIAPLQTQSGGTQIYFAARTDGLVKLDMSNPAAPTATKMTAINQAVLGALNGGTGANFDSIDGVVIDPTPITVGSSTKVYGVLYSYNSKTVVAVNLTDGVVAGTVTLNVGSADFSGASASIAGGIADGQRGLVWLAAGDGLYGIDPSNLAKAPIKIAQPNGYQINENIGGDPAAGILFSPDYENQGIVVYNLAEAKAYVMDNTTWSALKPVGFSGELDGATLDSTYKLAIITPESSSDVGLMAYTTPSGAAGATGSFTASLFKAYTTQGRYSGSAVDPVSHTALFVGEGNGLGVGVLDNPANASWKGFSSFVSTGSSSYSFEPHDPHTVGAFNIGGKPYGFVLQGSSSYQVVVLDLNAMLAAPTTSGVLNGDPLTDSSIAKLVSY